MIEYYHKESNAEITEKVFIKPIFCNMELTPPQKRGHRLNAMQSINDSADKYIKDSVWNHYVILLNSEPCLRELLNEEEWLGVRKMKIHCLMSNKTVLTKLLKE